MGSAVSLQHQDAGLIPSPAQGVKDPALLQLQCRLHLWLGSDPLAWEVYMLRGGQKKKKKKPPPPKKTPALKYKRPYRAHSQLCSIIYRKGLLNFLF